MPSSRGSSQPRDRTWVSCVFCIIGRFFTIKPPGKPFGGAGKVEPEVTELMFLPGETLFRGGD